MSEDESATPASTERYERLELPGWVAAPIGDADVVALRAATGEQLAWGYALPWMYRALASPSTYERMPAAPRSANPRDSFAYWETLLHLLVFSLGWARPDRGMRWWYDAGKPTDDPCLKLMADVWGADGQLDWFAAWLWTTEALAPLHQLSQLTGYQHDPRPVHTDARWIAAQHHSAQEAGFANPIIGGWDPLHLHGHCGGPVDDPPEQARMFHGSRVERRAVLMLDSMVGWYAALARNGNALPDVGENSWRVDVVVRPVGLLGTFRRSRHSKLWFACPHRFHVPGT